MGEAPASKMFDADVRVEAMIYLAGAFACESVSAEIRSFCEDLYDHPALIKALPVFEPFFSTEADIEDLIDQCSWQIQRVPGFVVQAATPYRRYWSEHGFSSGWGHYYTEWLYCPTEAAIAETCVAWAEARHAHDRAKFTTEAA